MTALELLASLIETAKRGEQQTSDELIRLKERRDVMRNHRMELEAVFDALKQEQQQP